jgi:hypothetical protein
MTTCNKLTDWQSYDKAYKNLKDQAKAAIERDTPSFSQVQMRLEKGAGHTIDRKLFPQLAAFAEEQAKVQAEAEEKNKDPGSLLASLALPDASQQTTEADAMDREHGAIAVQLEPLQGMQQRHNIEDEQPLLQDRMADLSEFVRERGGR